MSKEMDLVIRAGNFFIRGAFFCDDLIIDTFRLEFSDNLSKSLNDKLKDKKIRFALIGANNENIKKNVEKLLKEKDILIVDIEYDKLSINLDVQEPKEIGMGRIANAYGALFSHPFSDSIVIDMETALNIDVITKERVFLGGVICPGINLAAKALAENTDKLPLVKIKKPKTCLSSSIVGNIQSGLYFGLIGTIEKIVEEIISFRFSHSQINVIATGALAGFHDSMSESINPNQFKNDLEKDLKVVVDYFEPDLTFFGLYQILKENMLIATQE